MLTKWLTPLCLINTHTFLRTSKKCVSRVGRRLWTVWTNISCNRVESGNGHASDKQWVTAKTARNKRSNSDCPGMNKYSLSKNKTQEQHTNWLSNVKQLALKAYIQVTLYVLNRLHLRIYMYTNTYMCAITTHGKRPWIWRKAWRDIWKNFWGGT